LEPPESPAPYPSEPDGHAEGGWTGEPIEVVLFDFGGVVAPLADLPTVSRLERELDLPEGTLHSAMYEGDLWPALSVGQLLESEYWRELGTRVGRRDPETLRRVLRPIWEPLVVDRCVLALARELRARVRVALLSNATLELERQIEALELSDLFDPVINSARVGLRKPEPEVFRYALDVLQTPANRVLFIDDKERNTTVAQELGMPAIVFDTAANLTRALDSYDLLPHRTENEG
jgi:putative hydrolase of the HAD superfamily